MLPLTTPCGMHPAATLSNTMAERAERIDYLLQVCDLTQKDAEHLVDQVSFADEGQELGVLSEGLPRRILKTVEGAFVCMQEKDCEPIGSGSYKVVQQAINLQDLRLAAILKMPFKKPAHKLAFYREVRAFQTCAQLGVGLPLLGYATGVTKKGQEKGYILTEYAQEDLLTKIRADIAQDIPYCLDIATQIGHLVSVLASHNIVHCDIKPENILITNDICRLTDFGFTTSVAKSCGLKGTPFYIAPELARSVFPPSRQRQPNTLASDAWALGCTLYEIFHPKQHPLFIVEEPEEPRQNCHIKIFRVIANTTQETLDAKIDEELRHIPPVIKEIIQGLLTIDPQARLTAQGAYTQLRDAHFYIRHA